MTNEQKKSISRCKDMLKTAFPEYSGKFIYRLNSRLLGSKGIEVDMFQPNVDLRIITKDVTEVVL